MAGAEGHPPFQVAAWEAAVELPFQAALAVVAVHLRLEMDGKGGREVG